nr:MAG TPA: hypothetical protein [Caudoviricetes sp.]
MLLEKKWKTTCGNSTGHTLSKLNTPFRVSFENIPHIMFFFMVQC